MAKHGMFINEEKKVLIYECKLRGQERVLINGQKCDVN